MTKIKLTKEEVQRILKIEGNVSGIKFNGLRDYIVENGDKDAVKAIEWRLEELGLPLRFKNYSTFGKYPEAHACLVLLAILEHFGWDEKKAFDVGYEAMIHSFFNRTILKYSSIGNTIKDEQKYWKHYCNIGTIKIIDSNLKERYAVMCMYDFEKFHPVVQKYIMGYFAGVIKMITKAEKINAEQTKSIFNGDPYDEFKVTW